MVATALVAQGQPDEACAVGNEVVDVTEGLRSALVFKELEALQRRLQPHRSSMAVTDFAHRLDDVLDVRRRSSWAAPGDDERRPTERHED
jgi:hypothetical protein